MTPKPTAAFLSYATHDNEDESGAILELADELRKRYSLLTGTSLALFVDRDSIQWGEQWRQRIVDGLNKSTFLIPVITPRYFTREECRSELLTFRDRVKSPQVLTSIMPILYATVEDLSENSPDEAKRLIAGIQYVDWRDVQLGRPSSHPYRTQMNHLAGRLVNVEKELRNR